MNDFDKQFLKDRLRGKEYLPRAYFYGANSQKNYEPSVPYTIEIDRDLHPAETGYQKYFIRTAGADSPRPVTLRQKGSDCFLYEYSSILSGIRLPRKQTIGK